MFFMTREEAARWVTALGPDASYLANDYVDSLRPGSIRIETRGRGSSYALAKYLASSAPNPREQCLWITDYGIWPSSENLHLYYKVRAAYGDTRRIGEAPAHLFLGHEQADLTSFLHLALDNGWGGHLVSSPPWLVAHVSHDGWIVIETSENPVSTARALEKLGLSPEMRETVEDRNRH
jgi:hypothetical protein